MSAIEFRSMNEFNVPVHAWERLHRDRRKYPIAKGPEALDSALRPL